MLNKSKEFGTLYILDCVGPISIEMKLLKNKDIDISIGNCNGSRYIISKIFNDGNPTDNSLFASSSIDTIIKMLNNKITVYEAIKLSSKVSIVKCLFSDRRFYIESSYSGRYVPNSLLSKEGSRRNLFNTSKYYKYISSLLTENRQINDAHMRFI